MPNEEKRTLNERREYLRLIRKRYLTASVADLGPQIAGIRVSSRDRVGEWG